jgi:hypothetical protein
MFERTGFETCCHGSETAVADQSYRKELMLYLGKSLAMRDGLSLLLGAEDPEIAATYTDSGDKLFVLDKARQFKCVMQVA